MHALAQQEHPLVLFVDDWQWADSASLSFLKMLMADASSQFLLVIGAYRDNEVDSAHPFMLTLDDILEAQVPISTITLAPLGQTDVQALVEDTLGHSENLTGLQDLVQEASYVK